ncbi:MAG: sugar ABC transporter permease [Clostridiaceae bacterium]|nr:sugar ABC transporter permease [Clostridiaceae bacterium]
MLGAIKRFLHSQKVAPYVFVLPFILAFLIFFLYPTIQTIYMSFHKVISLHKMEFLGLKNYSRLSNVHFFNALKTNTIFTLACVITMIPIPMILSILLNDKLIGGRNFYRSVFFIPSLTSVIVAGVAFRLIFGSLPTALFNWLLSLVGLEPVSWNMQYWPAMFIMVSLALWRVTGVYMIYFLSGLQSIPEELYESANIDGANKVQKFFYVTLPLLKPTTLYVLTLVVFEGYRMFGESYVYWEENTPGDLGLTITRYIYMEAFRKNDMGFGSAIGITLLCIVLLINVIQLNSFGLFRKED